MSAGYTRFVMPHHRSWASYVEAVDTPENLIRMGVCVPSRVNKCGFEPSATVRVDGTARVWCSARKALQRDERFHASMDRVLTGPALPDFELPKMPTPTKELRRLNQLARDRFFEEERRKRYEGDDGAEAA